MSLRMNETTGLPYWYPSVYAHNEDIQAMVRRLGRGEITDKKVEWVATAVHRQTPWAGRPIPWDQISERGREQDRECARWALERAAAGEDFF